MTISEAIKIADMMEDRTSLMRDFGTIEDTIKTLLNPDAQKPNFTNIVLNYNTSERYIEVPEPLISELLAILKGDIEDAIADIEMQLNKMELKQ